MEIAFFTIKVCVAVIAGVLIGLEREFRGKDAGLKTNSLVSLGSCVFVLISLTFHGDAYIDTTRVLGQVVTGIGFIGAGTILQDRGRIEGLTSAATIWCSAAAGCLAALEFYVELGIVCALVLIINFLFSIIEKKLIRKREKEDEKNKVGLKKD